MSFIVSGTRSVVRALAFDAGGPGFDTHQWVGKFGVRLRFTRAICRERPSHTEHGWAQGSNTIYSVIHGLTGTRIELQPCLRMSRYDLDSNVARVSTNKARIYSIKQCLSRFEHDLQTIFIRLFYGSKYGLVRSVTA